jgi:hypothetical protein
MPPPHDCLAVGHGTSAGAFPLSIDGLAMMDMSRKPIRGSECIELSPPPHKHTHDMDGLSRWPNRPQICPPLEGQADSDGQNPDAGRSNGSNPRPTTHLRYPRPPTSSGVRWATCRWLLSGRSVDRAKQAIRYM